MMRHAAAMLGAAMGLAGCPTRPPAAAPRDASVAATLDVPVPAPAHADASVRDTADAHVSALDALDRHRVVGDCFAWSAALHAVACVAFSIEHEGDSTVAIQSLGGDDGGEAFAVYARAQPNDTDLAALADLDAAERRRADAYLRARGFAPWIAPWMAITPGAFTRVAGLTFRHRRRQTTAGQGDLAPSEYDDHVEIRCGHRWVAIDLIDRYPQFGEPLARVALLPDGRVVLGIENAYGLEGDSGSDFAVTVLDPRQACNAPDDAGLGAARDAGATRTP